MIVLPFMLYVSLRAEMPREARSQSLVRPKEICGERTPVLSCKCSIKSYIAQQKPRSNKPSKPKELTLIIRHRPSPDSRYVAGAERELKMAGPMQGPIDQFGPLAGSGAS